MFYKDGQDGESDGVEVKIGPIRLSVQQIGIGVMSGLVVLPVNLLVVNIFRKAGPKHSPLPEVSPSECYEEARRHEEFEDDSDENDEETEKEIERENNLKTTAKKREKTEFSLPHYTIYIAYVMGF